MFVPLDLFASSHVCDSLNLKGSAWTPYEETSSRRARSPPVCGAISSTFIAMHTAFARSPIVAPSSCHHSNCSRSQSVAQIECGHAEAEQSGEARQCVALRNGDERLRAIGVSVASDTGACRSAQARQSPLSDSSCEALLNARVGRTLTL